LSYTVLLTCVGGELLSKLALDLKKKSRHNIRLIGTDVDPNAVGKNFCDEFSVVPYGKSPKFIPTILELVEKYKINLIIPTSDEEAIAIASSKEKFDKVGCKIACTEYEKIRIMIDKVKTYNYLEKHGLHTPKWAKVEKLDKLKSVVESMCTEYGAVVVKPARSRGGRGVHIIDPKIKGIKRHDDRREIICDLSSFADTLMPLLSEELPLLVMEKLVEPVFDLDLLAWKGKSIRIVARRRINSAVPNAGHKIISDSKLLELGENIIDIFSLSWLYDCDVMYNSLGQPCVLEINPRQSGSIAVSTTAGFPMLDDIISLAKGEDIPHVNRTSGINIIPYTSLAVSKK